jgi:hypothetical protein
MRPVARLAERRDREREHERAQRVHGSLHSGGVGQSARNRLKGPRELSFVLEVAYSFLPAQLWHFRDARAWLTNIASHPTQALTHHLSGATFWVMKQ